MILRPSPRPTFEPPRAGALRGAWSAWYAFLRRTHLRIPQVPIVIKPIGLTWRNVTVVLVPIFAWFVLGRSRFALCAAAAYAASAVAAILCLGWTAAGWAVGVMFSLHGLGIAEYFYSGKLWPRPDHRVARYVGVVLILALVYSVGSPRLIGPFVVPLQTERGVLLINVWTPPDAAARDEILAFRAREWRSSNFVARGGTHLGVVFGKSGDVIAFHADTFSVNGRSHPRRPFMPRGGELTVPAQHTFTWPLDLRREARNENEARDFARKAALVPDSDLVGRPFRRWFFRTQHHGHLR